jgi:hypothetical protein
VHLGAAHLLERHLLADDHLGHARRAEVHRGVALDHDDDVAERGDVRAARGRRPEQHAHLGDLPGERDLVVEDAPRAAAAGEHLDLVGDARAGGVDEVEERTLEITRGLLDAQDLLDGARAPRAGLDGRIVGHDRDAAAVDHGEAGDHAVGGQLGIDRVGERRVLHERARVDELCDALAGEELAALGVLAVVLRRAALLDTGPRFLDPLLRGLGVAHLCGPISGNGAGSLGRGAGPRVYEQDMDRNGS